MAVPVPFRKAVSLKYVPRFCVRFEGYPPFRAFRHCDGSVGNVFITQPT
jgi:hypothetical protein